MNTKVQLNQQSFKQLPKNDRKFIRALQQMMGWTDQQLFQSGWNYNPHPDMSRGECTLG